ncbi:MAG: cytochrome ubiquinol oxidase subunit I [Bacteriovorax sp.]|nr:cytochrome ubiquinol oxidase subunit I [Bacteriovorax sp.]
MSIEVLSRMQFAFTAMFHYIFPPFSIGLGLLLVIFESIYIWTKDPLYEKITKFWIKIFAANFSLGVATGIVLEFEFGTNWSRYSRFVGDVFGSPLAAEGIFAFFLESGFLAILLFGWDRVKPRVHWFSTLMVALGSMMSAFWIIVANSWQQTPVAYKIVQANGASRAVITDFWQVVFNPSTMPRFLHAVVGSYIQGSFLVISISAYYLLKNKHLEFAKKSIFIALTVAGLSSVIQPLIGHWHAVIVAEHQPAKLAAFEGLFESRKYAPLSLVGWVDVKNEKSYVLSIPSGLSLLLSGKSDHYVKGLKDFPKSDWPSINQVFQSYHLMVALGMLFVLVSFISLYWHYKKILYQKRWLMKFYVFSVVLPVIANQAGWFSAERGRQPWIVQGLLRTAEGFSPNLQSYEIIISLVLFALTYLLLLFSWIYILNKEIQHGPEHIHTIPSHDTEKKFLDAAIDLKKEKHGF